MMPTLPGRFYTDPEVFAQEQRRIFGTEWMYVGRADEIPAKGDVLGARVGAEQVLVVRGRDGGLHGYLNVCRHRGATLCAGDKGNVGNAIRCPYHAWTYGLDDGRLVAAPNWRSMGDVDKSRYGLAPVGVDVWMGLVWVNLDPAAPSLATQLEPALRYRLGEDFRRIERYDIGDLAVGSRIEYDVAANWKIIAENFQECYHCGTIHPELVEQIPSFKDFELLAAAGYQRGGYAFAGDKDGFSLSGRRHFEPLPQLTAEESRKYFGMVLRPNCFLSLTPDHVIVHRVDPVAPDRTHVTCDWLFLPEQVASEHFDPSDSVELFHLVNQQDFAASEWCQPNMTSRLYADGGVLVPIEQGVIGEVYYRWYRDRMGLPARSG